MKTSDRAVKGMAQARRPAALVVQRTVCSEARLCPAPIKPAVLTNVPSRSVQLCRYLALATRLPLLGDQVALDLTTAYASDMNLRPLCSEHHPFTALKH
jgi:hypothetical protein